MDVIPFQANHFFDLDVQPSQAYSRQYVSREYLVELEKLDSYTVVKDEKLLCSFGYVSIFPTRALMWALLSGTCGPHMAGMTKIAKRLIAGLPHKRIEIEVDCEFEEGHRWARILGFDLEVERLRGFRIDGGDSALYGLVRS